MSYVFFASLLFPGVCLCESPPNRMSWFIFSLPFARWPAESLTFAYYSLLCRVPASLLSWELLLFGCVVHVQAPKPW